MVYERLIASERFFGVVLRGEKARSRISLRAIVPRERQRERDRDSPSKFRPVPWVLFSGVSFSQATWRSGGGLCNAVGSRGNALSFEFEF